MRLVDPPLLLHPLDVAASHAPPAHAPVEDVKAVVEHQPPQALSGWAGGGAGGHARKIQNGAEGDGDGGGRKARRRKSEMKGREGGRERGRGRETERETEKSVCLFIFVFFRGK